MELTFAQQSVAFLWSIVLGISMGLFYGILKFIRFSFSLRKVATFVLDVLFMLICAFAMFLFSLGFIDGYVRFYVIAGALIGFFAYRLTLGRLICGIYISVIRIYRKILNKISLKIKIFAKKLLKIGSKLLYNKSGKEDKFNSIFNKRKKDGTEKEKTEYKKNSGGEDRVRSRGRRTKGNKARQEA